MAYVRIISRKYYVSPSILFVVEDLKYDLYWNLTQMAGNATKGTKAREQQDRVWITYSFELDCFMAFDVFNVYLSRHDSSPVEVGHTLLAFTVFATLSDRRQLQQQQYEDERGPIVGLGIEHKLEALVPVIVILQPKSNALKSQLQAHNEISSNTFGDIYPAFYNAGVLYSWSNHLESLRHQLFVDRKHRFLKNFPLDDYICRQKQQQPCSQYVMTRFLTSSPV